METRIVMLDEDDAFACAAPASAVADYLAANGFALEQFAEPRRMMERLDGGAVRLLLMVQRPTNRRGMEVLRRVRAVSTVPVILRARGTDCEADRIIALESGAYDYLPSAASPRELLARIRTVLRRAEPRPPSRPTARLSVEAREFFGADGRPLRLTSAEFDLMHLLLRARGAPVGRERIFQLVFRRRHCPDDRAVDNLVARVRAKLGQDPHGSPQIKSVRGVGYVFVTSRPQEVAAGGSN